MNRNKYGIYRKPTFTFLLICFFLGFSAIQAYTQDIAREVRFDGSQTQMMQSQAMNYPLDSTHIYSWGLRLDGLKNPAEYTIQYRIKYGSQAWSSWTSIHSDEDLMDRPGLWMSSLQFLDEGKAEANKKVQLQFNMPRTTFAEAILHFIQVPKMGRSNSGIQSQPRAACVKPTMLNRSIWCSGNCPPDPSPVETDQNFMIVHHSASSNTSSNWAAVVESFYVYHTEGHGWDDIGYNWLIDPNGVIYIGRGDGIKGAHFCGKNSGTAGICMIGTFTNVKPTAAAMQSLKKLLGWKLSKEGLDPLESAYHPGSGKEIPRITGHRISCATECPGDKLFEMLQTFPYAVNEYMQDCPEDDNQEDQTISLEASLFKNGTVFLEWEADSSSPEGWQVFRRADGDGSYLGIASLPESTTHWIDNSVQYGSSYSYFIAAMHENDVSNSVKITTTIDGIEEGLVLFPNPCQDILNIRMTNNVNEEYRLTLHDLKGQAVGNSVFPMKFQKETPILRRKINVSTLQAGIYYLKIIGEDLNIQRKIVIQ